MIRGIVLVLVIFLDLGLSFYLIEMDMTLEQLNFTLQLREELAKVGVHTPQTMESLQELFIQYNTFCNYYNYYHLQLAQVRAEREGISSGQVGEIYQRGNSLPTDSSERVISAKVANAGGDSVESFCAGTDGARMVYRCDGSSVDTGEVHTSIDTVGIVDDRDLEISWITEGSGGSVEPFYTGTEGVRLGNHVAEGDMIVMDARDVVQDSATQDDGVVGMSKIARVEADVVAIEDVVTVLEIFGYRCDGSSVDTGEVHTSIDTVDLVVDRDLEISWITEDSGGKIINQNFAAVYTVMTGVVEGSIDDVLLKAMEEIPVGVLSPAVAMMSVVEDVQDADAIGLNICVAGHMEGARDGAEMIAKDLRGLEVIASDIVDAHVVDMNIDTSGVDIEELGDMKTSECCLIGPDVRLELICDDLTSAVWRLASTDGFDDNGIKNDTCHSFDEEIAEIGVSGAQNDDFEALVRVAETGNGVLTDSVAVTPECHYQVLGFSSVARPSVVRQSVARSSVACSRVGNSSVALTITGCPSVAVSSVALKSVFGSVTLRSVSVNGVAVSS